MPQQDFVHLHCHSTYSVQDALPTPVELAGACEALGFTALALTDHGRISGAVEFVDACRKTNTNVKPIVGVEVYTCQDMMDKSAPAGRRRPKHNHLTLLAQNQIGYQNLLMISSIAAEKGFYYDPRVDKSVLEKYSDGIITLSGCLGSELNQLLLKDDIESAYKLVEWYKEVYPERFFIELQYHGIEDQKHNLPLLIKIAKHFNLPMVASNDVHYVTKQDWKAHDVLIQMRSLREDKKNSNQGKKIAYESKQFYLKSQKQMESIFGEQVPESISNTMLVAEMVEDYFKLDVEHRLPRAIMPVDDKQFITFKEKNLPKNKINEAYLAHLAFKGLAKRGLDGKKEYVKRLQKELTQIWYMGVTDYFLVFYELIKYVKDSGILYGIRGSGVGSLVNYCLEISVVDPLQWNLTFERFLNPGRGTQYDMQFKNLESTPEIIYDINSTKELKKIVREKLNSSHKLSEQVSDIDKELWIIENQDLSKYYLTLFNDGVTNLKNDPNSWVAYVLGITNEAPNGDLKIKKIAELPDIDADIDDHRRGDVINWIKNRFGEDNVAHIGAWGTYGAKSSVVGALKTSEKFNSKYGDKVHESALKITKTISSRPGTTIDDALEQSAEFNYWYEKYPDEINVAKELCGKVSHLGVHAAGILISDRPIRESAPIEMSKGTACSGFVWSAAERVGLIKYDILGLDTYHKLHLCKELIKQRHGVDIDLLNIDFNDKNVFKLFTKGQTSSVFQFSSPGMRDALKKIKASTMEDLIAVVSLYRPGPMDYIPDYASRKLGKSAYGFSHPILEKHLGYTYGIMIYQEQAMKIAKDLAGFSWSEVDKLRKAISKKSGKLFDEAINLFVKRCKEREIPSTTIDEVIQLIHKFGGYAFNRAHAASYAVLAFWTAYMRWYYPSEWLASCIESKLGDDDALDKYLPEAGECNLNLLYPDVNYSELSTTLTPNGDIILPLTMLKNVGELARVVADNRPYDSFEDLIIRARPNKTVVKGLTEGNAFKSLDDVKDMEYDEIMEYYESIVKEVKKKSSVKSTRTLLNNDRVDNKTSKRKNIIDSLFEDF